MMADPTLAELTSDDPEVRALADREAARLFAERQSDTTPGFPISCQRDEVQPDFCAQDVHGWFELSYSSYLAVPRSLMQAMPAGWQHVMVALLERMHEEFPGENSTYRVLKIEDRNRFVSDPLRHYRYPDHWAVERARCACREQPRCHSHDHGSPTGPCPEHGHYTPEEVG